LPILNLFLGLFAVVSDNGFIGKPLGIGQVISVTGVNQKIADP